MIKQLSILLIGDACQDIYTYGSVTRVSPEAPVPVFVPVHTVQKDGMAGNVRKNLEALGCKVNFLHGDFSIKNRLIDERSKQHIMRLDEDVKSHPIRFETDIPDIYDAIVISDYDKGTVDYELIEQLIDIATVPIFIDTKKTDLARMRGCYVKINELEKSRATSLPRSELLVITHGKGGAEWNDSFFPAESAGNVVDVCGAGDTFLAAMVYQLLQTNQMPEAIKFANKASAITVQHVGVYAPRLDQIQ